MVSQLGLAPKYLTDFMHKPLSATSARPLRSTDRLDLFVPRVRSALAQCRAFAGTGPSTWNGLPLFYGLSLCPEFLKHPLALLSRFFSPGASALKAPLIVYAARGALQILDTIRLNNCYKKVL